VLRTLLHLAAAPIALGRVATMTQARNLGTVTGVDTAEPLVDHSGRLGFVTVPELMRHGTVRRKAWIT